MGPYYDTAITRAFDRMPSETLITSDANERFLPPQRGSGGVAISVVLILGLIAASVVYRDDAPQTEETAASEQVLADYSSRP